MKKILAVLLAGMMVTSLVACGGETTTESTTEETTTEETTTEETTTEEGGETTATEGGGVLPADHTATLTYVSWNDTQNVQNQATIDKFNEYYPNIQIEISYSAWNEYWNKLEAAASSGTLNDLVTQHTNNIEMYVNNGFVEDLTNLADYGFDFSYDNHPEGVKRLFRFDDKMWGVPKDIDCIVLVYNKDMFDAAGLDYPTDEWTWDDLTAACEVLTDKDNNTYGFAFRNDQPGGYASLMYQHGGGLLTEDGTKALVDSDESIEAMEWWMDGYAKYSPTQAMLTESTMDALIQNDTLAMCTDGNWALNTYYENEELADKFDIAALPHPADGEHATISNGLALCVTTGLPEEKLEAAKQFAAYFGSKEGQEVAAMGPSIPCYDGVVDLWAEQNKDLFRTEAVMNQLNNGYGVQWVGTELKTQWNQALETHIGYIYDGNDVATELKAAAEEMNAILAQEGK